MYHVVVGKTTESDRQANRNPNSYLVAVQYTMVLPRRKESSRSLNRTSLEQNLLQSFLCENYQRQSCQTFIGLTIRAKIIGGGDPF